MMMNACATLNYYSQAVSGHLALMAKRQSVVGLIQERDTPERLRSKLILVSEIRDFASQVLELPDNGSYRSYVEVEGEALVWSVVATGPLSVYPEEWCYPVIGCASYRGFFDRQDALDQRQSLERKGLDVAVDPVPAYSSLGWFDDPIPGTLLGWADWRIAGLIFHELAHQKLYVPGDSAFNEAFANQVQQIGVQHWLEAKGDPSSMGIWRVSRVRERAFVGMLMATRGRLEGVYAQPITDAAKLECKSHLFSMLRKDYEIFKQDWDGYSGFDYWFKTPLNNARLASVATYEHWMPALERLYTQSGENLGRFYRAVTDLGRLPPQARKQHLMQLLREAEEENPPVPEAAIIPIPGCERPLIPPRIAQATGAKQLPEGRQPSFRSN